MKTSIWVSKARPVSADSLQPKTHSPSLEQNQKNKIMKIKKDISHQCTISVLPWKLQKISGFLTFSGGTELDNWWDTGLVQKWILNFQKFFNEDVIKMIAFSSYFRWLPLSCFWELFTKFPLFLFTNTPLSLVKMENKKPWVLNGP